MALALFDDILSLEREIGGLLQGITGNTVPGRFLGGNAQIPQINVLDTNDEIVLVAELPGVRKEDVQLTVDNRLLTLSGERKLQAKPENATWLRNEIRTGSFSRVLELPRHVAADKISAELSNGVLRVVLPKADEAKPREVKIK